MNRSIRLGIFWTLLALLVLLPGGALMATGSPPAMGTPTPIPAGQVPPIVKAPLPPAAASPPQATETAPHSKGAILPPMDLSHLTGQRMPEGIRAQALPSQLDWRNKDGNNYVTSVKNQSTCGSCYAFASLANIESKLLIDGAGTYNFSENNAKECNWYDTSCSGGNYTILANLFSRKGTVLESDDPYQPTNVACKSSVNYQKTLLDWRMICGNVMPSTEVLKQYIYDHGPVYTFVYAGDGDAWETEFGTYDGSYTLHYPDTDQVNHNVLIVGWDDSLPHAGGTGAWLVKNSWGTGWGDSGYFRIAYGSAGIGRLSSFMYAWQNYDNSGDLWYYDEGGWTNSWGCSDTTAWGLARFTPNSNTNVTRVEFWTNDTTTDVDVYLYDNFDGSNLSSLLAQKLNNSFDEAGYHSVALNSPVAVSNGDDIVAVVKITNDSYGYPIVGDPNGPHQTGRTYISCSDTPFSWIDMGSDFNVDIGLRVRVSSTASETGPTVTGITPNSGDNTGLVSTNLAGSNFRSGATVALTRSGETAIDADNVTVVTSNTLTCDLDLTGATPGKWNVVVTNPNSQSGELANGFTVTGNSGFVYLPAVLKNYPPLTDLYVQNDLGTTLHLTINGVGSRDVPTGLYHWGTFPPGTFNWSATASGYYPSSGTKTFYSGEYVWRFYTVTSTSDHPQEPASSGVPMEPR